MRRDGPKWGLETLAFPPTTPMPSVFAPRPRRRASMIPHKRKDRIEAVRLVDFEGFEVEAVARVYRRSPSQIYRWLSEARTWPEYATMLRKAARAS